MSRTAIEDRNTTIDVTRLHPTDGHILLKIVERERTSGGIHLPKGKATELCIGEVIAVGPGSSSQKRLRRYPIELARGDVVVTMGYIGECMSLRSGDYRFVRDDGIWARVFWRDAAAFDFEKVEPRYGRILVRPASEETTLSGRIYLPNGNDKNSECRMAEVLVVGPGVWDADTGTRRPMQTRAGDHLLMIRYAGAEVTVKGETLRLCDESDIRVFLDEED